MLDRVLGAGAVLLAIPVALAAWRWGIGSLRIPGPGFWPLLIAAAVAGLGAALLLRPAPPAPPRPAGSRWGSLGMALATLVFFVLALEPLGYPLTVGLLLLAQLRAVEGRAWRGSLLTAVLAAGVSFVLFRVFLKVPLPAGVIPLPPGW
jgi:putative tricarboxylic transport membrane protein